MARIPERRCAHCQLASSPQSFAAVFTLASAALFVGAAWKLNPLCFKLSVPVLLILFFYSYTKRFTSYSHLVLGFCLGMAPLGTWIAVRGDVRLTPVLLCLIVMLWTAGFDIIYACQDVEFDRQKQLFSLPKRLGVRMALNVSTGMHVLMLLLLVALFVLKGSAGSPWGASHWWPRCFGMSTVWFVLTTFPESMHPSSQ